MSTSDADARDDIHSRIVRVAARLMAEAGPSAVTTRGVAQGAGVQPPTIYRLFGDKEGLLEAVAEHVMSTYVSHKTAVVDAATADDVDPLDDLRDGWQRQIDFAVTNPALFRLFSDPERVARSEAARAGRGVLHARIRRIASTGRLRVDEDRAVDLVSAAGIGAIHVLLAVPPDERDMSVADDMFTAVLDKILSDPPERPADAMIAGAVAFRTTVPHLTVLNDAERTLLRDWLDRIVADGQRPAPEDQRSGASKK